jgi:hypothetical protein
LHDEVYTNFFNAALARDNRDLTVPTEISNASANSS